MYRRLMIGGLALALAGCVSQQEQAPDVRVEDLSNSRAPDTPEVYTVQTGDTLYGIAWRHDMDYRDMARVNNIPAPYTLQPGQRLTLVEGGKARAANADASQDGNGGASEGVNAGAAGAVVATGLGSESVSASAQGESSSLDWLLPAEGEGQAAAVPGPVTGSETAAATDEAESQAVEQARKRDQQSSQSVNDAEAIAKKAREESQDRQRAEKGAQEAQAKAEAEAKKQAEQETQAAQAEQEKAEESKAADSQPKRYSPVAEVPWSWPVNGSVIGDFGEGSSVTAGIDIDGQKGQPVKAAGPGIVVYAGDGVRGYGNLILLKHNDQFLSAYAHNEALKVKENDVVSSGDVIATMGDSGADGVRLHFEVRKDGQPQNPLDYLPKR